MGGYSSKISDQERIKIYKRVTLEEIAKAYQKVKSDVSKEILKSYPVSCNFTYGYSSILECYDLTIQNNEISYKNNLSLYDLMTINLFDKSVCSKVVLGLTMTQYKVLF